MGSVKLMVVFALLSISCQCAAQEITVSVFTVTSRSVTVQWTKYPGASSYKVTVTECYSPGKSVYTQFGANIVLGSVISLSPDTSYNIQVEALDGSNVLSQSPVVKHGTAPAMPTILKATSKESQSVTVEFTEITGASSYILRAESDGFFSETSVSSSPGTVLNLQPYNLYTFSVLSVNSGGRSQPSLTVDERTVLPAPQLKSSSPSKDAIDVEWEPVENAVRYCLYIIKYGSTDKTIINTTDTNVTFSYLEGGTVYSISAKAWDPEGREGDLIIISQITRPCTPGSIELSVVWMGLSEAELLVEWANVVGASDYLAQSTGGLSCNSAYSSCTLSPVNCGQIYNVTVTASNEAGSSYPSAPVQIITFPCPPEPLWVEEREPGNCTLNWGPTEYADSYVAYVKRDDGLESGCNTTATSCDFPCNCSYTYLMSVYAYNEAGSSPPGVVLNYTTLPCCAEDVQVSLVSTDTLEITWAKVRSVEVYETRAADGSEVILCNDTAPVCALSGLDCDSPYTVTVIPCNERGCNRACTPHTRETAPCTPEILSVAQINATSVNVTYTTPNRAAEYRVELTGEGAPIICESAWGSCVVYKLPCGCTYEVSVVAVTTAGTSLPSYTVTLETAPCCPEVLDVEQVTQAMSNVTWSAARGAQSYITSLTSSRGEARCHTLDTSCLMGCITCGTNYTVSMEAISRTGHKSECTYQGFSTSACCPPGVKLYRLANNTLRVYWRSSSSLYSYIAEVVQVAASGTKSSYTCTSPPGANSCDVSDVICGSVYNVVVAPLTPGGTKVSFCPERTYSVSCSGSNVGMVIYRGKRSAD